MRLPARLLAFLAASTTAAALGLTATSASAEPAELADSGGIAVRNGVGVSLASIRSAGASTARGKATNGITYHGGPVLTTGATVYYIWYGTSPDTTVAVLTHLANNIGGSPYFGINTTYKDAAGASVLNSITYGGSVNRAGTKPSLSDADIQAVVAEATDGLGSNDLSPDPKGVYFVLTAPGITASSGFLTKYCGWHTYAPLNGQRLKYSFVGNPNGSSACLAQSTSPNGDRDADGMASVIAHELEEAVTDPELNAWYDNRGYENADKCAWTFGSEYAAANGSRANMSLGGRDYLIQQNWVNASGGYCALKIRA